MFKIWLHLLPLLHLVILDSAQNDFISLCCMEFDKGFNTPKIQRFSYFNKNGILHIYIFYGFICFTYFEILLSNYVYSCINKKMEELKKIKTV
jgi:hypothetical protein